MPIKATVYCDRCGNLMRDLHVSSIVGDLSIHFHDALREYKSYDLSGRAYYRFVCEPCKEK